MISLGVSFASVVGLATLALGQQCPLQFEGRIPSSFSPAPFDTENNIYSPTAVFGQNLTLSQLVKLPGIRGSIFDINTIPFEVTINDQSIFAPSLDNVQVGFRRAELLPASNNGTDPSTLGAKTLHFSLMKDDQRPLNHSHEYQLVFLESNDFSANQIALKTGTILGQNTSDPNTLQLFGNSNQSPPQVLFSTPFASGVFHNFAAKLDFDASAVQVFYSMGLAPLNAVTGSIPNDLAGQGQFHFGVLKKPIGGGPDITKSGSQPLGIDEGIIYGGVFEEDSSNRGCISLEV